MYPLGLLPFFAALAPDSVAVGAALAIPALVLALSLYALLPRSLPLSLSARALCSKGEDADGDTAPVRLPGSGLAHILPFFHRRFDFINGGFALAGQAVYQFSLLRTPVIVLSGAAARRDFFQAKDLDLNAGFKFLSGAIPMVPGVTSNLETRRIALIHKRLVASQTSERLASLIPQILEDARRVIGTWGVSGSGAICIDPFQHLSELLFQTTVRSLAFAELADDPRAVARLKRLYDTLDAATTPATVLLPWWVPSASAVRRLLATKRIYDVVAGALDKRVRGGSKGARDDTPQMLIDAGDERLVIVGFIMGLLVAGARSTGTTASWLITFLSGHPEWREKAADELRRLVSAHATHLPSQQAPGPHPSPTAEPPRPQSQSQPGPHPHLQPHPETQTQPQPEPQHRQHASDTTSQQQRPPQSPPPPLSSLTATLASVPLSAWEAHTPVLDAIIRETLRVAEPHVAMRQYLPPSPAPSPSSFSSSSSSSSSCSPSSSSSSSCSSWSASLFSSLTSFLSSLSPLPHRPPQEKQGKTLFLGGKAVPPGAFVMYPFSDVHLSAEIYSEPWRWDPGRRERELKAPYAYVGMGAGSTVCLGKRLATLELKLVTALFVLGCGELRAVDRRGAPLAELPRPNWNDVLTCKPPKGSCFVRFERTADPAGEAEDRDHDRDRDGDGSRA